MKTRVKSRGERNCNPLNVRITANKWIGKVKGTDKIFESFITCFFGYRCAYVCMLKHYRSGNVTLTQLINKWAPKNENDTTEYIQYLSIHTGIFPCSPFAWNHATIYLLMFYMSVYENGYIVDKTALSDLIQREFQR